MSKKSNPIGWVDGLDVMPRWQSKTLIGAFVIVLSQLFKMINLDVGEWEVELFAWALFDLLWVALVVYWRFTATKKII